MKQFVKLVASDEISSHRNLNMGVDPSPTSEKQLFWQSLTILAWQICLALPLGLILSRFNIGGMAWIFSGIASGVIVLQVSRIFYQLTLKPNRSARHVGLVLVGLTIGFSIAQNNLIGVVTGIPIFVFLTLFLLISGTLIGYIYSRLSKTNLLTAMLATVPGGVGVMAAIAADYNKNVTQVALVQVIRVTSVVLLIPMVARILADDYISAPAIITAVEFITFTPSYFGLLLLLVGVSLVAVYIAILCKIPAAHFFAALLVGMTFNPLINSFHITTGITHFALPSMIRIIGQTLLGITIGEYWGEKPDFGKKTIAYAVMSTIMTLFAGAIAAYFAMQLTSWDWLTCMLVTAPGGAAEMILVALTLNHNVEVVTVGHLVRLIAINSSLPIWVFLFRRLDRQLSEAA